MTLLQAPDTLLTADPPAVPVIDHSRLEPRPRWTPRFGTDRIRGVANLELTPWHAFTLGRATARLLLGGHGRIVVGQDTRRSGDMLASAFVAGATSMGVDVARLGVCPTPALAHLVPLLGCGAGVMVSASHNPAQDNGLKVLDGLGAKVGPGTEAALEALMAADDLPPSAMGRDVGHELDRRLELAQYVGHRSLIAHACSTDLRVQLDCANGAASVVGPIILARTGADLGVDHDRPDGSNINAACGATAPSVIAGMVVRAEADVGFAFDGDADRCVAADERGAVVDGDQLLGIIALDLLERGRLAASTVVLTVLSNAGLVEAIEAVGGRVIRTPVGDRSVAEAVVASGAGLGGEKSGHIIVREHGFAGDGIVTALTVLGILARTGRPLSELAARVPLHPQEQRTVPVRDRDRWRSDSALAAALREAEFELAGHGRILVRASGTEPAIRIMVEGPDATQVRRIADALSAVARDRLS